MATFEDSLRGYGHLTHVRSRFRCVYCGYDGRSFPTWLQLAVDHVMPQQQGGADADENKVTVCQFCNAATSRMQFEPGLTREEIIAQKRQRVQQRQAEYFQFWLEHVAPQYAEPSTERHDPP
jgi:hypothetical protein